MKPQYVQLLTGSRIGLAVVLALLVTGVGVEEFGPTCWVLWVGGVLMGIIEISDLVDGYLARKWRMVTDFGKMFDPYADAVSRVIVYWTLSRIGLVWPMVPLVLAVRDTTVAYVRAALAGNGRDVSARWLGKTKAIVHAITGCALVLASLVLPSIVPYLVAPASILVMLLSVVAGLDHLRNAWPTIWGKFR